MKLILKNTSVISVVGCCRNLFTYLCCSLISTTAFAQQVILAPGTAHVPVNRIQAPGYIPPPPVVRRPWWFTVQTVSGPGAVMPVPRVTHYRPQVFRFPEKSSVLAGKPITPPTSTFPSQWASAPPITPSAPVAQKPDLVPPSSWAPSVGSPPPQPRQEPQKPPAAPAPPTQAAPSLVTQPHLQAIGRQLRLMQVNLSPMLWQSQFQLNRVTCWRHSLNKMCLRRLQPLHNL